jgi:hypothetical protein
MAAMMMQAVETVKPENALDAAREIANIIAGVIKAALPRPSDMTVPGSCIAPDRFGRGISYGHALSVVFRHLSGDLLVQVWEDKLGSEPEGFPTGTERDSNGV